MGTSLRWHLGLPAEYFLFVFQSPRWQRTGDRLSRWQCRWKQQQQQPAQGNLFLCFTWLPVSVGTLCYPIFIQVKVSLRHVALEDRQTESVVRDQVRSRHQSDSVLLFPWWFDGCFPLHDDILSCCCYSLWPCLIGVWTSPVSCCVNKVYLKPVETLRREDLQVSERSLDWIS